MATSALMAVTLLVPDYDQAIAFYVGCVGFELVEDTDLGSGKRWVRIRPKNSEGACLLLARAVGAEQIAQIGRQAGGRVFLFFQTDDFRRDHARMLTAGVKFRELPRHEPYGIVAVFEDPYGNCFDLIEPRRE